MNDDLEGEWKETVILNWDTMLNFTCRPKKVTKDLFIAAVVTNKLRKTVSHRSSVASVTEPAHFTCTTANNYTVIAEV